MKNARERERERKKIVQIFNQRRKREQIERLVHYVGNIFIYMRIAHIAIISQSHTNTCTLLHTCNVVIQGNRIYVNSLNCW